MGWVGVGGWKLNQHFVRAAGERLSERLNPDGSQESSHGGDSCSTWEKGGVPPGLVCCSLLIGVRMMYLLKKKKKKKYTFGYLNKGESWSCVGAGGGRLVSGRVLTWHGEGLGIWWQFHSLVLRAPAWSGAGGRRPPGSCLSGPKPISKQGPGELHPPSNRSTAPVCTAGGFILSQPCGTAVPMGLLLLLWW